VTAPSTRDPFVAGASRWLGGPWGRHTAGRTWSWLTPIRVVLVLTILTSLLGFLQKSSCTTHPWANDYQYTRVCYTDVFVLYTAEHLDGSARAGSKVGVPYRDHPVEYPAVIGAFMWAGAEITHLVLPHDPHTSGGTVVDGRSRMFFRISVLLLAACALLTTWTIARLAGRQRVWDAAMFALAPVIVFDGFINWDFAAVALTGLGMWAWSRRRPVLAGVFLGLGVATKLYPLLVLLALAVLCLRTARLREWMRTAIAAAAAFVAAYLPFLLVSYGKTFPFPGADCAGAKPLSPLLFFWKFSQIRGADWGSPWLAAREISGSSLDNPPCGHAPTVLNLGVGLATMFVVAAVCLLAVAARQRPRVPQVAFLLVAGFVLVNKVDSPQYCLWLLPLAVLALPRWGPLLVWQTTEVLLTVANFLVLVHQGNPSTGLPMWAYLLTMFVRDAALLWVMGLVVRDVLRPGYDVVRHPDPDGPPVDDPAGGVLDRAADRWAASPAAVPALAGAP
jgi:uncharacterized membrane protein